VLWLLELILILITL